MPRVFIALPLDTEVRRAIATLVRPEVRDVRWVQEAQYHITLKFLGDISDHRLQDVIAAVDETASDWQSPLRLQVQRVGAFPGPQRARVLWVGLQGDTKPLTELHELLERSLVSRGFAADARPFRPHVTIGRMRNPGPMSEHLLGQADTAFGSWTVPEIQVMKSILRPRGPIYRVRHTVPLPTR